MENCSTKPKKITLLNEQSYRTFLNHAPDGVGHTHIALISDGKEKHKVYISVYPKSTHPKSLVNEITAYLLASALNLPVAKHAFVITANVRQLKFAHPEIEFDDLDGLFPAWCISSLSGTSPKYFYNLTQTINNPVFLDDIGHWDKLLDVVVFDDWLGNSDRNAGNLIRIGKHRYALIDNEDIAGCRRWLPDEISPEQDIFNKLAWIIWGGYNVRDPKDTNRMIQLADKNTATNISILQELVYWWKLLLSKEELEALHRFIMKRSTTCSERIRSRYGALL
ncbi:MAG: hypothetical protein M0Q95_10890 [Porticoccaceae bacterium]|nr:hypothetical protein [Porticoccaceae bacterium]